MLFPLSLLFSQDGKYRSPKSFGSEAEYIKDRLSRISDVRLITFSNEILIGNIFNMTDSSLSVCVINSCYNWRTQPALSFDYSEIDKLVVMKKSQVLNGMAIGFLVGAAIGAPLGYAVDEGCEDFSCVGKGPAAFIVGIMVGIPGAIIGGIAGANVKDQHYYINGNINLFRNIRKMIGNEAIFFELP